MPSTCANPSCYSYPMRGANLCGKCATRRDAWFLVGALAGAVVILFAILRFC